MDNFWLLNPGTNQTSLFHLCLPLVIVTTETQRTQTDYMIMLMRDLCISRELKNAKEINLLYYLSLCLCGYIYYIQH